MIHYTCDRCRRSLDTNLEARYVVHIDVEFFEPRTEDSAADESESDEAVDYLNDLHELLQTQDAQENASDCQEAFVEDAALSLDSLHELLLRGEGTDEAGRSSGPVSLPPVTSKSNSNSNAFQNTPHAIDADFHPDDDDVCTASFDLCATCYAKYAKNPLGHHHELKLHFSNN